MFHKIRKMTSIQQEKTPTVEEQIDIFFQELLSRQEPLGEEFARVLNENFWSLIVRTPDEH